MKYKSHSFTSCFLVVSAHVIPLTVKIFYNVLLTFCNIHQEHQISLIGFTVSTYMLISFTYKYLHSFQEGRRGYLEGLANHYSKHVTAKYEDILTAIENVRISKWTERHVRAVNALTSNPTSTTTMRPNKSGGIVNQSLLPNSHSQTIYVPGKYLVSPLMVATNNLYF